MITFTTLGAGQYYLTPGDLSLYNSAGHLLETPQAKILFDFGRGCLRTLTALGISVHDIDLLCLSHLHPDHVADVLPFLQTHFVEYAKMPERRNKQLTIIGPVGVQEWFKMQCKYLFDTLPYKPLVSEAPTNWQGSDFTIKTALLKHAVPNIGLCLTSDGKTITYSGDTGATPALDKLAAGSALLVLECANNPGQVTPHHLSPEECGQIATKVGTQQLILTHYGSIKRQTELRLATQKYFCGTLTFGKEGKKICMS
ncbi:MAG: beta-lactamase protein [uncultured bacterium]|nr:MAG: beta-lactamase protein [uncultured bacterium]